MHSQCEKRLANKVKIVENKQRGGKKEEEGERVKSDAILLTSCKYSGARKKRRERGKQGELQRDETKVAHTHAHVFCKTASKQLSGRQRRRQQRQREAGEGRE